MELGRVETEAEAEKLDRLPDDVVLNILNRVGDMKTLVRCYAVSRRFRHHLIPKVTNLLCRTGLLGILDRPDPGGTSIEDPRDLFNPRCLFSYSYPVFSQDLVHHVLGNFPFLRTLHMVLPFCELLINGLCSYPRLLFRWRAHFGSTLHRCLIFAALSIRTNTPPPSHSLSDTDYDSLFHNISAGLTKYALIAAAQRHRLLRPYPAQHTALESLVMTDADGQGVLLMDQDQLDDLRRKFPDAAPVPPTEVHDFFLTKVEVSAMRTSHWYVPFLELSSGVVLKGAMLVLVCPSEEEDEDMGLSGWIEQEFADDGMCAEAAQILIKQRTHYMEIPFVL